ncbi:MAG: hypothetical protein ACRD28_09930 [Acidobacteriaceae bacterium]
MKDRRRNQIEPKDFVRLDRLLESLKKAPVPDLPLAVKDRLNTLYVRRLRENPRPKTQVGSLRLWLSFRLKPVAACALLIMVSIGAMLLIHLHRRDRLRTGNNPGVNIPKASPSNTVPTASSEAAVPRSVLRPNRHTHFAQGNQVNPTEMIVRLPYSDSDIATGTSATIQVSMSQSQLVSLGFPLPESLQNRLFVANLTLGDDGLPRAISLPLPLEVIK